MSAVIVRDMFVDSVSTNQVQLRRVPGRTAMPTANPAACIHQITITTGLDAAANADTAIFAAICSKMWRVTLEPIS